MRQTISIIPSRTMLTMDLVSDFISQCLNFQIFNRFHRFTLLLLLVSSICLTPSYPSTSDEPSMDVQGADRRRSALASPHLGDRHRVVRRSPLGDPQGQNPRASRSNSSSRASCRGSGCNDGANISSLEAMRRHRVNVIKAEILKKLRMNSAPNLTINGGQLRSMSRILDIDDPGRQVDGQSGDDDFSTPVVMIIQSRTVPVSALNASNTCYFKFPDDLSEGSQVLEAHLGVHLRRNPALITSRDQSQLRLLVKKNTWRLRPEIVRRRRIQGSNTDQWYSFDVRTLVQSWINHPDANLGITIATSDPSASSMLPIVQPRNSQDEILRPFIEIRVKSAAVTRQPRSAAMDCNEESQEQRCCRYPLSIDFEAFRWDWIMVPKRYDAFYCSGKCNYLHYQSPSRVAVSSQVSSPSMADPCCAPTQVAPLSVIYYDEKLPGVVHSSIPGMVVKQCGCQ